MNGDNQAIADWLSNNKITEVECRVPDIMGNARGKFVPVRQFLAQGADLSRLNGFEIITDGTGSIRRV